MRILVAEDDRISRRLVEVALVKSGHEVVVAKNGLEAWDALQCADAPKLAILDWMMPGIDGVDVCRRLRKADKVPYTYVVLLSAKSRKQDIIEGLNAGADDYIKKPFDIEELYARVRSAARILELQDRLYSAQVSLQTQATHDNLTGLANRLLFCDRLEHMLVQARRYSQMVGVMFLDLDNFKLVNDTFGHICGDMLLKSVADRLTGILREADTVCRLGGDEFTLMLPHIHAPSDVATIARKVIQELRVPFQIHGQEVCVTASIGIALYPNDGMDVEGLLKHADLAMYRAKDRGRDQCQFYCDVLNPAA